MSDSILYAIGKKMRPLEAFCCSTMQVFGVVEFRYPGQEQKKDGFNNLTVRISLRRGSSNRLRVGNENNRKSFKFGEEKKSLRLGLLRWTQRKNPI